MEKYLRTSELRKKIPDTYELVLTLAKRTRELNSGSPKLTSFEHFNPLTVASHELMEGLLKPVQKPKTQDLMSMIAEVDDEDEEFDEFEY